MPTSYPWQLEQLGWRTILFVIDIGLAVALILQIDSLHVERHEPPERSNVHRQVDDRPAHGVLAHDLAEKP